VSKTAKHDSAIAIDGALLKLVGIRPREALENALQSRQLVVDEGSDRFLATELEKMERDTRPSAGSVSASGKDKAAFRALSFAASLMNDLAGWAIDHQRGLAIVGLEAAMPFSEDISPAFVALRERNDQHDHEIRGKLEQDLTPVQARLFILNVLRPMSRQFSFLGDLIVALEALQFGETLPILQATNTRKTGLIENRAKLTALCHMAYEKRKGTNKNRTVDDIADLFAANSETITKNWAKQTREALGRDYVDHEIRTAEVAAEGYLKEPLDSFLRPHFEERYGRPALLHAAMMYKRR
jgi:hypothetical protein